MHYSVAISQATSHAVRQRIVLPMGGYVRGKDISLF